MTLEGPDGSGKSTQARLLATRLQRAGWPAVHTFEPGGTPLGAVLRRLLLEAPDDPGPVAEMLLMAADRAQHVGEMIRPALQAGKIVVCERFVDSSLVYQGYAAGMDVEQVQTVNDIATGGLTPDLTIFLDVDPARGLAQAEQGRGREGVGADRIERRDLAYHRRVRAGYQRLCAAWPDRIVGITAENRSPQDIHLQVARTVEERLTERQGTRS